MGRVFYLRDVNASRQRGAPMVLGGLGAINPAALYKVFAPVLKSPLSLDKAVGRVAAHIESSGKWEVQSFAVVSGSEKKALVLAVPLLAVVPSWLQPTIQTMRFNVRRRDGVSPGKASAIAMVEFAAAKENMSLAALKEWFVEVRDEVVVPSIPTVPKVKAIIPKWVFWAGGAAVGLYVLNSLVGAKKAFLG